MMNFSPEKLFLVGIIALMVLGPHRLPKAARRLEKFVVDMRRVSSSLHCEVRDALAEPCDAITSAKRETGLTEARRSVHDRVSVWRGGITSVVFGEATGRSVRDPKLATPPTPPPDPGVPPAPEDPSLN
jgi:sec-independent protein translocase protein TatB